MRADCIPHGTFILRHYKTRKDGGRYKRPFKVQRCRNSYVNVGGALLQNLLTGAGGQAFDHAHSFIGFGDSATATVAADTDLHAALATAVNIVSSTNATPIAVTATAHGYTSGDTVTIAGHTVNTNANGTWIITVTGANTFTLTGSAGNGVGGATGAVQKGNRMRIGMDATFPSLTGQNMVWQSTLGSGVCEWLTGIQEIALFNGFVAATSTMLARGVQNFGVKAIGTTVSIQYITHVP